MIDSTTGFLRVKTDEEAETAAKLLFDRAACTDIPDAECEACPGCRQADGSYCRAHPSSRPSVAP